MSIRSFLHNSSEALLSQMALKLTTVQRHPLQPLYVVVQSPGLIEWVKLQLANATGIAANIHFITPNYLPFLSCKALGERYQSGKKAEELLWGIHQILGSTEFLDLFPKVAGYYSDSGFKQMQLAVKLSDLFDQYSLYRADDIAEWSKGKPAERLKGLEEIEEWQRYIWHQLSGIEEGSLHSYALDNAGVLERLQSSSVGSEIKGFFPSIQCFALSTLSPYHSQLLTGLSQHTEVNFFLLNPSPEEYWYDIRRKKDKLRNWKLDELTDEDFEIEGNDFLLAQGRLLKSLMHQLSDADPNFFNYYEAQHTVSNKLLLHKLQKEIVENKAPIASSELSNPKPDYSNLFALNSQLVNDGSLQISSHYSLFREVQALYDFLLDRKQINPSLRADEIAVVSPSLAKYAPYIKAIFDNAPQKLNYNLLSLSDADEHSAVAFVFEILNLTETDFTAEKVLALLEYPEVAKHFGIRDKNLIRSALKAANIRWKIENEKNESELHQVSWQYGIKRLVLGLITEEKSNLLADENDYLFPISVASTSQHTELLQFIHFVDELTAIVKHDGLMRGIQNCGNYVLKIIETFLPESGLEESTNIDALLEVIHRFNDQAKDERSSIDLKSYIYAVQHQYREEENKKKIFKGAVVCASPKDIRAIPFKVIAYLGLGSGYFPKQTDRSAFDLMQLKPKFGDRSFKDNDRHLFIESFMCAKEAFYVSFLGKSDKTDTDLPPSVVVDELLAFVNQREASKGTEFAILQHPLHATSQRYAEGNEGLFTYRIPIERALENPGNTSAKVLEIEKKPASISDVIRYFKNAPKWYFQYVCNLSYNENNDVIDDNLLIEADALQLHNLKVLVLNELISKRTQWEDFTQSLQSKGLVQLGEYGVKTVDDFKKYFEDKLNKYGLNELYHPDNRRRVEISGNVSGSIEYFLKADDTPILVLIRDSGKNSEGKYLLELFVNACFLAKELNKNIELRGLFKDNSYSGILSPLKASEALELLFGWYENRYDALQFFHADAMRVEKDKDLKESTFRGFFKSDPKYPALIDKDKVFKLLHQEAYAFNPNEMDPDKRYVPSLESAIGRCWAKDGKKIFDEINACLQKVK